MKEKKKDKKLFWKIYAASLGGLTLLMAILLIIGYNAIVDYDKAQGYIQDKTAEITADFEKGDYSLLFGEVSEQNVSMIFEKDLYVEKLNEMIENGGVSYRKGFSADRYTRPVYDIFAGDTKIASVEFAKSSKESSFGFDTFNLEKIVPKFGGQYEVSVVVPAGAALYLNDTPAPDSIIRKSEAEREAENNALVQSQSGAAIKCTISGLLEAVTPKVVYESGAVASLAYDDEKAEWYCIRKQIEITAPSNCTVTVNGTVISSEQRFVKESGIAVDALKTPYAEIGKTPITLVKYAVSGLERAEKVEVSAKAFNGSSLVVVENEETGAYEVEYLNSSEMLSEFGTDNKYLIACAEDYAKFMHGKASKSVFLAHVMKDTAFYEYIDEYWVTFSNHNSYWFEDQTVRSLEFYDKDLFSATISLDYWIKGFAGKNDATKEYPVVVTFFYANTDSGLKIVDWILNGSL